MSTETKPQETRQTVGYDAVGHARTFDLKPGEKLPAGWSDTPPRGTHPHDVERGLKPDATAVQKQPAAKNNAA